MPELPDVEAVRRHLVSQGLAGRTIAGVELLWTNAVREPSAEELRSEVSGRRILDIRRRAKYLILDLDGRPSRKLVLHLGMTGSLLLQPADEERPRYTRNIFVLEDGSELRFVDPRKFGAIRLVPDDGPLLADVGPEPLDPEFTDGVLSQRLTRRKAPVKALLCDQSVVAGIGNIYADEVLFQAGIHPLKAGAALSQQDLRRLHRAIRDRLSKAVDLLAPLAGREGPPTEAEEGLETLLVPRSEGAACGECGAPIERVTVRARSSYFCPVRQPI